MNQLIPNWGDSERALPLLLSQSAITTVAKSTVGDSLVAVPLLNMDGKTALYTGPRLGVDDLEVLMAVVHHMRGATKDDDGAEYCTVVTSYGDLLDTLEWTMAGVDSYKRLEACLKRLQQAHFDYKMKSRGRVTWQVFGTLIGAIAVAQLDHDARKRAIAIPISMSVIGIWSTIVRLDWNQRRKLKSGLARWLQSFVICEAGNIRSYPVTKLHAMANSIAKIREFRRSLREACEELKVVGWLESFSVTEDTAMFKRAAAAPMLPSPQMRLDLIGGRDDLT